MDAFPVPPCPPDACKRRRLWEPDSFEAARKEKKRTPVARTWPGLASQPQGFPLERYTGTVGPDGVLLCSAPFRVRGAGSLTRVGVPVPSTNAILSTAVGHGAEYSVQHYTQHTLPQNGAQRGTTN